MLSIAETVFKITCNTRSIVESWTCGLVVEGVRPDGRPARRELFSVAYTRICDRLSIYQEPAYHTIHTIAFVQGLVAEDTRCNMLHHAWRDISLEVGYIWAVTAG
jgi:hypothetical protein